MPTRVTLSMEVEALQPLIWREVVVPGTMTLSALHMFIQQVMGWSHTQPFKFYDATDDYVSGTEDALWLEQHPQHDVSLVSLNDILDRQHHTIFYHYGVHWSGWRIQLRVLSVEDCDHIVEPQCLDGERASPLEAAHGPEGYVEVLRQWSGGVLESYVQAMLPPGFDPNVFDTHALERVYGATPGRSEPALTKFVGALPAPPADYERHAPPPQRRPFGWLRHKSKILYDAARDGDVEQFIDVLMLEMLAGEMDMVDRRRLINIFKSSEALEPHPSRVPLPAQPSTEPSRPSQEMVGSITPTPAPGASPEARHTSPNSTSSASTSDTIQSIEPTTISTSDTPAVESPGVEAVNEVDDVGEARVDVDADVLLADTTEPDTISSKPAGSVPQDVEVPAVDELPISSMTAPDLEASDDPSDVECDVSREPEINTSSFNPGVEEGSDQVDASNQDTPAHSEAPQSALAEDIEPLTPPQPSDVLVQWRRPASLEPLPQIITLRKCLALLPDEQLSHVGRTLDVFVMDPERAVLEEALAEHILRADHLMDTVQRTLSSAQISLLEVICQMNGLVQEAMFKTHDAATQDPGWFEWSGDSDLSALRTQGLVFVGVRGPFLQVVIPGELLRLLRGVLKVGRA